MAGEGMPDSESKKIPKPLSVEEFKGLDIGQTFYMVKHGNIPLVIGPQRIISFGRIFGESKNPDNNIVVTITKPPSGGEGTLKFIIDKFVTDYPIFLNKEDAEKELSRLQRLN